MTLNDNLRNPAPPPPVPGPPVVYHHGVGYRVRNYFLTGLIVAGPLAITVYLTWSFITWVVYACFLHARATAGWRGRRAAYFQLAGFTCLMFNLVGVNLFITGLHSYAGLG